MSLLRKLNEFLEENFGNGIDEDEDEGVVVTAVAEPYIVIRGEKQMNQYSIVLDFANAKNMTTYYQFDFDVEESLAVANSVTLHNVVLSNTTYRAVPAYYDFTHKRIYPQMGGKYFAVAKTNLAPVDV